MWYDIFIYFIKKDVVIMNGKFVIYEFIVVEGWDDIMVINCLVIVDIIEINGFVFL